MQCFAAVIFCQFVNVSFAQTAATPDAAAAAGEDNRRSAPLVQPAARPGDEAVVLDPFEVTANERGYFASNAMSGTRLNSKIEDLAASLTVVTKQQMSDLALLDLNDVFLYEASTEGSGTYTEVAANGDGVPIDNTQLNPNTANRIRGLSSANMSFGNFQLSGRIPVDPLNIDALEISRGPNSSIFGLGSAGGSVNQQPAGANLTRNRAQVEARGDSFDGYRTSLDVNRVLKEGVLAVRASAAYQHDGFDLKPSGTNTRRLNAMVRYQPFKNTTLTASHFYYKMTGNRPNTTTPLDGVSGWLNAGKPTYDPVAGVAHLNGQTFGPFTTSNLPGYFATSSASASGINYSSVFVDERGQIGLWTPTRTSSSATDPNASRQNVFFAISSPEPLRQGQPLWASNPVVGPGTDIYDWTRINLASLNRLRQTNKTTLVSLTQIFFNTPRQMLAAEAGYFREEDSSFSRNIIGSAGSSGRIAYLNIDVNERLVNGKPNPYFLRPYLGVAIPADSYNPLRNETGRLQVAYKLDLRQEKGALRWLGLHQLAGFGEYKDFISRQIRSRDIIASDHSWLAAVPRATVNAAQGGGSDIARNYFRYYVGDNAGNNVDYAPTPFAYGNYDFTWGNGVTGNFRTESASLASGVAADATGATSNTRQIVKTRGVVLQSFFARDRVVTTLGLRRDQSYNKFGDKPVFLADGTLDYDSWNRWQPGAWNLNEGTTKTAGVVVKPLPWLYLHYNWADSFQPASAALDVYERPLVDPTGKGRDYGFTLNLLEGKLNVRVNRYETREIDARAGAAAAARTRSIDFDFASGSTNRDQWLNYHARGWVTRAAAAQGQTLTEDQILDQVASIMQIDRGYLERATPNAGTISETADAISRGTEIEFNYNPNNFWTAKLNVVRQEAISENLSPAVTQWIAERLPVWQKIRDPETGTLWFDTRYGGRTESAHEFLNSTVLVPLSVDQALEGKSRPQVRKYRANFSTSYRLAGITDQKFLRQFTIGGALRWEDKGAINFYGVETPPAVVTALDANRPIWDKAHFYVDAFVAYRMNLFNDKVHAKIQLNVRNLTEDGRLQATNAYPDGRPWTFRIVEPRRFILSASFDL